MKETTRKFQYKDKNNIVLNCRVFTDKGFSLIGVKFYGVEQVYKKKDFLKLVKEHQLEYLGEVK